MGIYNFQGDAIMTAYDVNGNPLNTMYDVNGNALSDIKPLDYDSYSITDLYTYVANGFNGMDVYDGVIAQLQASDKLYLFDLEDGTAIKTAVAITSAHGASASFARERYQESDPFPLMYISSDAAPPTVFIDRITDNGTMLTKTLRFPTDKAGYYAGHAYDLAHNIMYMVGYLQQSYTSSDGGNNKVVVSKWDMSELTQDSGYYTPTFISRYFRDFIYVMQGKKFFDGLIWISSGYNDSGNQYVYAMNPDTGVIEHTITMDDHVEMEDLAWVYDTSENRYWMLVGQQNGSAGINYSRIDFATAT